LGGQPGSPASTVRFAAISAGLCRAAARHGTPLYVTDVAALDAAVADLAAAFPDPWIRQYSLKANDVAAVVRLVTERGLGANVVSRGEWAIARRAGVPNERITVEGVGKTDADLREVVGACRRGEPPLWIAIESVDEARALAGIAGSSAGEPTWRGLDVLFRLNPDVQPDTHRGLAVGTGGSKFGMDETELAGAIEAIGTVPGLLRPRGLHVHVGSQLRTVDAWRDAVRKALALLALWRGSLEGFDTLDIGGGFPVEPGGVPAPSPDRFARELPDLLDSMPQPRRPRRLAIEPGRVLVARAGWLVARVLHVRERGGPQVVVDAGMTELIRPALYGAQHDVIALTSFGRPAGRSPGTLGGPADGDDVQPTHVEGPICETTDHLGQHLLPPLRRGDLVAIADVGAYGAVLSSSYNGRPRPAQVLLHPAGRLELARRRGSTSSLG
jgi:diaminopimelate decarboxylase